MFEKNPNARIVFLSLIFFSFPLYAQESSNEPTEPQQAGEAKEGCPKCEFSPFSMYHENYLLTGWDSSSLSDGLVLKFQFSAKFKLPLPGFYLAYSQRSFMDLMAKSIPFYDHNFMPELFYVHAFKGSMKEKYGLNYIQAGYLHESNGRDGTDSRSWERVYVSTEFQKGGFYAQPMVWFPFLEESENSDVEKYYGYAKLELGYVWKNNIQLNGSLMAGTDFGKGSVKVDFSLPFILLISRLPSGWGQSDIWFQFWQGHGESFKGFRESSTAIAAGFGFKPPHKRE